MQKNDKLKAEVSEHIVNQTKTQKKLDQAKTMINDLKTLQSDIKTLKEQTLEGETAKTELTRLKEENQYLEGQLMKEKQEREKYQE